MPSSTITFEQLLEPLIDVLNSKYPTAEDSEYQIPMLGQFGVLEPATDEVAIELPDDIANHAVAANAIATLLRTTGSEATWLRGQNPEDSPLGRPLRFSLVKRSTWAGYFWAGGLYLVIDHLGEDLDADAAARQVELLVAHLSDSKNLIELTPEERAVLL